MIKDYLKYVYLFIGLVLLQVFVLNNIYWLGYVNPQVYILFLLLLPFEISGVTLLVLSFFLGLMIDIPSNTLGVHISATLLVGFIRPTVLRLISSRDVYEKGSLPRIKYYGVAWFMKYCFIITFIYTLYLYILESLSFVHLFEVILHSLVTTVVTVSVMVLSQFLFIKE
ncbi:rod shape-determining protein MreD [Halosquirtibacter xylanolyticus]|uniref:rod shape-determining protein MreD n=1 Tax=Halosquirtibacter xylanolyticus TaxID=3374599 RepID=UPI00374A45C4|nr:rod shape-determining protein MreD [Prolixibacteraceae bacterium]